MKALPLLALAAAFLLALSAPAGLAAAQMVDANATVSADHGNWTLKQREDWLTDRLHASRDDGAIDGHEFDRVSREMDHIRDDENRLRGDHDGQLTDNETIALEGRLNAVADQIHWMHENQFRKPW
jgi:hypothetical protein